MVDIGTHFDFGKHRKPERQKSRLVAVGTKFFFGINETGELIARRLIPVTYIGAV